MCRAQHKGLDYFAYRFLLPGGKDAQPRRILEAQQTLASQADGQPPRHRDG
jgi:hypothetical protein